MFLTVCANPSVDSFWSISHIEQGTTNRSTKESFYPGGKGIHTAFTLNELDQNVTTLGLWGGQTGRWLQEECNNKGITTIGPMVDDWNRLCITVDADSPWDETELLGSGPKISKEVVQSFKLTYHESLKKNHIEAVLISGSAPRGFENILYQELIKEAKQEEIPAFLDASGPFLQQALDVNPYAIHINRKEGKTLSGKNDPVEIVRWLSDYCTLAAVTAGAEGLYMAHGGNIYHAFYKLDDKDIISTIGSGDCLLAGLCLATLEHGHPEQWATFAAACGSANCIYPELGMLKAEDVEQILNQVTLNTLKL